MSARITSCGVVVRDGAGLVLIGQATGSARWDIPKGLAEPGESFEQAASRELREETGLVATGLRSLGLHRYLPAKDLALFACQPGAIDLAALRCASTFRARDGRMLPEFSRFALVDWNEMLARVGKNMARVLATLRPP